MARNPQLKSKLGEWLQRVPKDPDGISAHTYNMAPMPDEVLKAKLQAVMFESTSALPFLTPEDKDRLVKNAQLLDYLRIAPKEDPDLNDRLTKALGHPIGEGAATATAPTVESIMSGDTPDFSQQKVNPAEIEDSTGDLTEDLLAGGIGVDIGGGM